MGTVLTFVKLIDAEALSQALIEDISSGHFDDVYRNMGLTGVTYWIQRSPDVAVTMLEGRDIDVILEKFATSTNPVVARWRAQFHMWVGPEEADGFWEASRHRLLSWATEEEGAESQVMVFREPRQIEIYRQLSLDFQQDPQLRRLLDRVRRRQGFTRVETWHQQSNGQDVVLAVVEANDLKRAMAQFTSEANDLDKRLMEMMRNTILDEENPPPAAELLARWRA